MTQMTEEWVAFWYQALAQNADYGSYCSAREAGDQERIAAYEARFDRVAEIYADFGPVDGWSDEGLDSSHWKEWFAQHRHLFVNDPVEVLVPDRYRARPSSVLVEVPLHADLADTIAATQRFLTEHYKSKQFTPRASPKYQLHMENGRVAHGYEQVRQACLISAKSYVFDPDTFEYRSIQRSMIEFLRHEIDSLGWTLDPISLKQLKEAGIMDVDRFEPFKVRLNKCRRDFIAFSRNTIRGRFPDATPFDSTVVDQMKGEQSST